MSQKSRNSAISRVAIFWDLQNVKATEKQIRCLMMFADTKGHVVLKKAYAHWKRENEELEDLLCDLFEPINVPSFKRKRNRADYKLIEHCRQRVLHNPDISTVILLSQDGDFTCLVNELKANGKQVIVVAHSEKSTNRKLIKLADEFYLLSQIEQRLSNLLRSSVRNS
ncbi:MAG: NYN domain-containing protein [Symploca sp. SIO1A3]|nr:NYN domain-containing protein [Symploca sp. SIO1A3]